MNPDRDFDRLLDEWFADGPREAADRVVIGVADRIERQSQRPAWRLPGKDVHMNLKLWGAAAAVLVVAIFAGSRLLPQSSNPGSGGGSPTPIASPTPSAAPSSSSKLVQATRFLVPLTLTLSGDWTLNIDQPTNLELFWQGPEHVDLGFHPLSVVTLPGAALTDPWVPVPTDFVAWIRQRPEFTNVTTRAVTIGGRSGTEVDAAFVWTAGTPKRDFLRYSTGSWLYDQYDEGHRIRFVIVPGTAGDGFIIVVNAPAADFDPAVTELDTVLSTVQFTAPTATVSPTT